LDGSDLVVSTLGMALEFGCLTAFDSRVAGPGRKEWGLDLPVRKPSCVVVVETLGGLDLL